MNSVHPDHPAHLDPPALASHFESAGRAAGFRVEHFGEAHGCPHATTANSPAFWRLRPLYVATITALSLGGDALYGLFNIAFYVVCIPALLVWLTYGALRNARTLRQLKKCRA